MSTSIIGQPREATFGEKLPETSKKSVRTNLADAIRSIFEAVKNWLSPSRTFKRGMVKMGFNGKIHDRNSQKVRGENSKKVVIPVLGILSTNGLHFNKANRNKFYWH